MQNTAIVYAQFIVGSKFDPTPPGCWHSFQGPCCVAMLCTRLRDAIETKNPKHSSEQKGAKVPFVYESFFETCVDKSSRLRVTKTSNERAVLTDKEPRTHLGDSKAKAKTARLASEISGAPHHVQKMFPDELFRSLQSPNLPQNKPSKPSKGPPDSTPKPTPKHAPLICRFRAPVPPIFWGSKTPQTL